MSADMKDRTVLVTGANTGIGRAAAEELARRGARVVLACRSEEKTRPVVDAIRAAHGERAADFLALDLADLASVRDAAKAFLARGEPIHVLLNNAGLAGQRGATKDGFEVAFGVNHLGHFLWTLLLLDRLKESAPARVVNVASKNHQYAKGIDFDALRRPTRTIAGLPEYAVSKLANILFTQELARRLSGSGVTAYALHPGVVASDVWRHVPWPVRAILKRRMLSNEEGARTSVYCASAPELEGVSGRYYDKCAERAPHEAATEALARELWERSEAWVRPFLT
ncbi:MAG: SDR family oxidoreductase [Candidatus Methylomirabilis sp.]|nr:SDR family oxidoreductase [Deltaproteobacteria bacterium]